MRPLAILLMRRSIPAWAGETTDVGYPTSDDEVYPRVGGGNLCAHWQYCSCAGLSPRGRGKLLTSGIRLAMMRSIPAWAGET